MHKTRTSYKDQYSWKWILGNIFELQFFYDLDTWVSALIIIWYRNTLDYAVCIYIFLSENYTPPIKCIKFFGYAWIDTAVCLAII